MRVAMYYTNSDVRVEECPVPQIGEKELLVKVFASGICGSDVMEWYRIKKAPRVLGHEISGEVVKCGLKVKNFKVGDRVFVSHHVPCNTCTYCLKGHHTACDTLHNTNFDPGGFAEYIRIPEINVDRGVFLLPDTVTYDEGTFVEPLACVLRGQRIAGIQPGESVIVIGSGISGIIHILAARILGAGKVFASDISRYRLDMAKKLGADEVFYARENYVSSLKENNNGRFCDHVICCTGSPEVLSNAAGMSDRGGTILFFAPTDPGVTVPIDINYLWNNNITFRTSYGAAPNDIHTAIELMEAKRFDFDTMITHKFPLEQIGQGFQLVSDAKKSLKVIIEPNKV